jgi:hypothetical protein
LDSGVLVTLGAGFAGAEAWPSIMAGDKVKVAANAALVSAKRKTREFPGKSCEEVDVFIVDGTVFSPEQSCPFDPVRGQAGLF